MNASVIELGPWQLALALVFVLLAGASSLINGLGLAKDLAVGALRTVVQLVLMGYALVFIFNAHSPLIVLGVYFIMICFAITIVRGRVKERSIRFLWPTFGSMLASYYLVAFLVNAMVVQVKPWWEPQYFLPLGGMVIGNSLNALSISLERLFSELRNRRQDVEMRLSLGANRTEASRDIFVNALKAGMIPSINSMMGVGVVFIPGMATGQILAGADPLMAVRYQIMIMFMVVGSTSLGSFLVLLLVRRRCFGPAHRLLLR